MRLSAIEAAIDAATRAWVGWDFSRTVRPCTCGEADSPHVEVVGPGTGLGEPWTRDRSDYLVERGHSSFCADEIAWAEAEFARQCRNDADDAAELGLEALVFLRGGDVVAAWQQLEAAAALEQKYDGENWEAVVELFGRLYPVPLAKGEKP